MKKLSATKARNQRRRNRSKSNIIKHVSRHRLVVFRSNKNILEYVNGERLNIYSQKGTVTPDHVIRTKQLPMVISLKDLPNLQSFRDYFFIENFFFYTP